MVTAFGSRVTLEAAHHSMSRGGEDGTLRLTPSQFQFYYCALTLRRIARALLAAAIPAVSTLASANPHYQYAGLAWLVLLWWASCGLARRARFDAAILVIDAEGITDSRLDLRLRWQDIACVCRLSEEKSFAIDIIQRWPVAASRAQWRNSIAWRCQCAFGVPAVTISTLLMRGSTKAVVDAISHHRPDLLAFRN